MPRRLRTLALASLPLLSTACASLQHPPTAERPRALVTLPTGPFSPASPESCERWDDARMTWGTAGTVAGALSGTGGALATLTPLAHNDSARLSLAVVSVVAALTAAAAAYQVDGLTTRYVSQCTVPTPAPSP